MRMLVGQRWVAAAVAVTVTVTVTCQPDLRPLALQQRGPVPPDED